MLTHRPLPRLAFGPGALAAEGRRMLPEEVAVALSFNGSTQAVMMATPADLEDFAYGFAMTEGLAGLDEIEQVEVVEAAKGIDVQIWVKPEAEARLAKRRRTMAGPVGCGLCGIDSLEEAVRELPRVKSTYRITPDEVRAAIAALPQAQPLHDTTRAVHAAGFWCDGHFLAVREDVGRHNALDKLAGAWLAMNRVPEGVPASLPLEGAVVLTSRVSIDMVQKVAAMGQPVLIAVSAPTAHAVAMAEAAGITLIALARPDRFEVFTHPSRLECGPAPQETPMSHDAHSKLIYMANQIAKFMESKPHDEGLAGLSSHINDFWEPRMRKHLFEVLDAGGQGLRPLVVEAAQMIRRPVAA